MKILSLFLIALGLTLIIIGGVQSLVTINVSAEPITKTFGDMSGDGFFGTVYCDGDTYSTVHDASSGTHTLFSTTPSPQRIGQEKWTTSPYYGVFRTFVSWYYTSGIPDNAVITSAKIRLWGVEYWDLSSTDFYIHIQKWITSNPSGITIADYSAFDGKNYDSGAFSTTSWVKNGWNEIVLNDFSIINKQGTTKLVIRSSRDINSIAPSGQEEVGATELVVTEHEPQLVVTYAVSGTYGTILSINANPRSGTSPLSVTITGNLKTNDGLAISDMYVDVYYDGAKLTSVKTDSDGNYIASTDVLAGVHSFQAQFAGTDAYVSSSSSVISVESTTSMLVGSWYVNDVLITSATQVVNTTIPAVSFKFVKTSGAVADSGITAVVKEGGTVLVSLTNAASSTWAGSYTFGYGKHTLSLVASDGTTTITMSMFCDSLSGEAPSGGISTQIIVCMSGMCIGLGIGWYLLKSKHILATRQPAI